MFLEDCLDEVSALVEERLSVPELESRLTDLLFSSYEDKEKEEKGIDLLKKFGRRKVCQYQFKKSDIVWICRSCQKDDTCVLCNDCFQNSNHVGHEVFFYHSNSGGCCDCGDEVSWAPSGFCPKHGSVDPNPLQHIPKPIIDVACPLFSAISIKFLEFAADYVASYSQVLDPTTKVAVLHASDFYTAGPQGELVTVLLTHLKCSAEEVERLLTHLNSIGQAVLQQSSFPNVDLRAALVELTLHGMHSSILERDRVDEEMGYVAIFNWLYKLAQTNDGMCKLIGDAFMLSKLVNLLEADGRLSRRLRVPLHRLLLVLMANIDFKSRTATAYAYALPKIADTYATGFSQANNSTFSISVQFLNRQQIVLDMSIHHGFLTTLTRSLSKVLQQVGSKKLEPNSSGSLILQHRRYYPMLADLKVIFTIPGISRLFVSFCLGDFLRILSAFHYMHPQKRQRMNHVEFEDRTWMSAFNLYISLASTFRYLVDWFASSQDDHALDLLYTVQPRLTVNTNGDGDKVFSATTVDGTAAVVTVASVPSMLTTIFSEVLRWQNRFTETFSNETIRFSLNATLDDGGESLHTTTAEVSLLVFSEEISFHLLLHRFLGSTLLECLEHQHLDEAVRYIRYTAGGSPSGYSRSASNEGSPQLVMLVDFPLRNLVVASQIRLGMWIRNGQCMADQLLNYRDYPLCRTFRDLDLFCVQFFGSLLPADTLLLQFLKRFEVHTVLLDRSPKDCEDLSRNRGGLIEEFLVLCIILLTEVPVPAAASKTARLLPTLRRELVHRLAEGPTTFSELQETALGVGDSAIFSTSTVEEVIRQISECKEAVGVEAPKFVLKADRWSEYDPCYYHVKAKSHQEILETRPKVTKPAPMVAPLALAHWALQPLRLAFVQSTVWFKALRTIILSIVASRTTTLAAYEVVKNWKLVCPTSALPPALQMLTLMVHTSESASPDQLNTLAQQLLLQEQLPPVTSEEAAGLPSLLVGLLDLKDLLSQESDEVSHFSWLSWVIARLVELLRGRVGEVVEQRTRDQDQANRAKEAELKKKRARERAMQAMQASAAAFSNMCEESDEEGEELSPGDPSSQVGKKCEEIVLTCIVCQSSDNKGGTDMVGRLCYVQSSTVLRNRPLGELHDGAKSLLYRTQPRPSCCLRSCGHTIHDSCFRAFRESELRKLEYRESILVDGTRQELQCPFCKKLCNVLLPGLPKMGRSISVIPRSVGNEAVSVESWLSWTRRPSVYEDATLRGLFDAIEASSGSSDKPILQALLQPYTSLDFSRILFKGCLMPSKSSAHLSTYENILFRWKSFLHDFTEPLAREVVSDKWALHKLDNALDGISYTLQVLDQMQITDPQESLVFGETRTEDVLADAMRAIASFMEETESRTHYHAALMLMLQGSEWEQVLDHESVPTSAGLSLPHDDDFVLLDSILDRYASAGGGGQPSGGSNNDENVRRKESKVPLRGHNCGTLPLLQRKISSCLVLAMVLNVDVGEIPDGSGMDVAETMDSGDDVVGVEPSLVTCCRWLNLSYLTQHLVYSVLEFLSENHGDCVQVHASVDWPQTALSGFLDGLIDKIWAIIWPKISSAARGSRSTDALRSQFKLHCDKNGINVVDRSLRYWLIFLRFSTRLVFGQADSRRKPNEAFQVNDDDLQAGLAHWQLWDVLGRCGADSTAVVAQITIVMAKWVHQLIALQAPQDCCLLLASPLREVTIDEICLTSPQLVRLEDTYTALHSRVLSLSSEVEVPAFCMICGCILSASGNGSCTEHGLLCSGDSAMIFLLQDHQLVLFHDKRGAYYPSPYVDEYGESHQHFRGKPLRLDKNRLAMLRKMWLAHNIPIEVVHSRSSSQRVIILGYF